MLLFYGYQLNSISHFDVNWNKLFTLEIKINYRRVLGMKIDNLN